VHGFTHSVIDILGRPGEYRDFRIVEPLEGAGTTLAHLNASPVEADLRAESVVEGILVTGRARAGVTFECSRCLREFPSEIAVELCELFTGPGHDAAPEEDSYAVAGTDVDLEPMLRDALALALPIHPLCRADCKGLCAHCGADLNKGSCGCVEDDTDPRWAGLDVVRERLRQRSG
jgi:uncharacterized protein